MTMRKIKLSRRGVLGGLTGLAVVSAVPLVATNAFADSATKKHKRDVPKPDIFSCDDWGARPANGTPVKVNNGTNKIIVHHTAFPNTTDHSKDYAFQNSRDIQDLHMDQNGWMDTGQHFTNSQGGFITEGRHGSLDALLDGGYQIEGAHCVGQNDQAIGIENDGTFLDSDQPSQEQWNSLINFCAFICQQYKLASSEIYGHMDFNSTQCPGNIHDRLPELRDAVQKVLDGSRHHHG
jgi:hypothetical protein